MSAFSENAVIRPADDVSIGGAVMSQLQNLLEAVGGTGQVCVVAACSSWSCFSKLLARSAMVLRSDHVPAALEVLRESRMPDADVPGVLLWLTGLLFWEHPKATGAALKVRNEAARTIDSIVRERWQDVPDNRRLEVLQALAEHSDIKVDEGRSKVLRILSERGTADTAEYLERESVRGYFHYEECRKVAAEIRQRLETQKQGRLSP